MKKHLLSLLAAGALAASLGCGGGGGNSTTPDLNPSISDLLAGIYDVTLTVTAGTTCSDVGAVGSTRNDTITVTTSETDDSVEIFSEAGSTTFTGTRSGNNFDVSSTETTALSPVCSRQVLTEISGNQTDGNLTGTSTVTTTTEPVGCAENCQTFYDVSGTRR